MVGHNEALAALCSCAATISVLSYEEAINGYFALRGWSLPRDDVHDLYDSIRDDGLTDSRLTRAAIVCQIGKDSPFQTIKAMADHYGVHPEQLRSYIKGVRAEMEPKMLRAFGLERVIFYRPASTMSAGTAETRNEAQGEARQRAPQSGDAQ